MPIPTLLISAYLATAVVPPSEPAQTDPFEYETVTIAPNVYGFFEKAGMMNAIVSSNVVAIVGSDAVLIYDTGQHPRTSRRMVADIKRITSKPIRYVVISHWHDDHWVATSEFAKANPGVQVISHSFTDRLIETRKDKFSGEPCKSLLHEQQVPLRAQIASGKRPDSTVIPEVALNRLKGFDRAYDAQMFECDAMAYRPVDRHVDDSLSLDLGGIAVQLKFLGRGNTAGDLVAWLPESRVILTGDLLVYPFPFATQPYITEWARVLRAIDGMDVSAIVPGHGPVMQDKEYVRAMAELLESIATQARAAYTPGMTADQLRAKIDLSAAADRFSKGDRFIMANFVNQMKRSAIDRMWQELTGQWKPEGIDS